jgi:hypothetical protein
MPDPVPEGQTLAGEHTGTGSRHRRGDRTERRPMTPRQAAAAAKPVVLEIGGAFTESPAALRRARLLGIPGWAFYVAARGGVLGDVPAGTVAAALGFLEPEAVADGWQTACRVARPMEVASAQLAECCRWGVHHLGPAPQTGRLVELLDPVVAAADATGMPLFAAWRGMPVPAELADERGARAAVDLYLLREHYIAAHLPAARVGGMTALETVLAGPDGEVNAAACGWPPPYPPIGPLVRRRLWAEAVTDRMVATAFVVLDTPARAELVELLTETRTRILRPAGPERGRFPQLRRP